MRKIGRFKLSPSRIAVGCLFLILLGVRMYSLGADPPHDLSVSGGLYGDEPTRAHNARNKVLFGQWVTDEYNPVYVTPLVTLLAYAFFSALGVGLIQLRLGYVLLSTLGLCLLYLALKKDSGQRVSLFATLLLGFNFIYIMYNRLALSDTLLAFMMILTVWLWQIGLKRPRFLFLAGISSFACYTIKGSCLYFILSIFLALLFALLQRHGKNKLLRRSVVPVAYYAIGLTVSLLLWLKFFFLPHREYILMYGGRWFGLAMPTGISPYLEGLLDPICFFFFTKTPVPLILGWAYVPFLVATAIRNRGKVRPIEILCLLWLLGGTVILDGLRYRPLRYFVPLIPPLCILAAFALDRLYGANWPTRAVLKKRFFVFAVYALWVLGIVVLSDSVLVVFILVALAVAVAYLPGGDAHGASLLRTRVFAVALIVVSLGLCGGQYLDWDHNASYDVKYVSQRIGGMLEDAYIAGLWAPLGTIENRHRSLIMADGWFNDKDTFSRYPVTHLLLWDGNMREEIRHLWKAYPDTMEQAEEIWQYDVKGHALRLLRLRAKGEADGLKKK